jgi:hypothetical protein
MAIVLAAVVPISLDVEARSGAFGESVESFALLTSTESDIIIALWESLSSGNSGRVVLSVEIPDKAPVSAKGAGAAMASEKPQAPEGAVAQEKTPPMVVAEKEDRRPSVDEVISLIQVGQRALRVSEPGVKVVPQ